MIDMRAGNLRDALAVAIREQVKIEKAAGYFTDSGMVAGWKQILKALLNDVEIRIVKGP